MSDLDVVKKILADAIGMNGDGFSLFDLATRLVERYDVLRNDHAMFEARRVGKEAQIKALETSIDQLIAEVSEEKKLRHRAMQTMARGAEFDEEAKAKLALMQQRAEKAERSLADARAENEPQISFQTMVGRWVNECFGGKAALDRVERNHRFLEEALELVQSCGCTREEAVHLVDYVYGREAGDKLQEVGGVMTTLAALCNAQNIGMEDAGARELARVWTKIDVIRQKQANKPKNSPLPSFPSFPPHINADTQ